MRFNGIQWRMLTIRQSLPSTFCFVDLAHFLHSVHFIDAINLIFTSSHSCLHHLSILLQTFKPSKLQNDEQVIILSAVSFYHSSLPSYVLFHQSIRLKFIRWKSRIGGQQVDCRKTQSVMSAMLSVDCWLLTLDPPYALCFRPYTHSQWVHAYNIHTKSLPSSSS